MSLGAAAIVAVPPRSATIPGASWAKQSINARCGPFHDDDQHELHAETHGAHEDSVHETAAVGDARALTMTRTLVRFRPDEGARPRQ